MLSICLLGIARAARKGEQAGCRFRRVYSLVGFATKRSLLADWTFSQGCAITHTETTYDFLRAISLHTSAGGLYYVNAGTWVDDNLDSDITRTFAVITTGSHDTVSIFRYLEDGSVNASLGSATPSRFARSSNSSTLPHALLH